MWRVHPCMLCVMSNLFYCVVIGYFYFFFCFSRQSTIGMKWLNEWKESVNVLPKFVFFSFIELAVIFSMQLLSSLIFSLQTIDVNMWMLLLSVASLGGGLHRDTPSQEWHQIENAKLTQHELLVKHKNRESCTTDRVWCLFQFYIPK